MSVNPLDILLVEDNPDHAELIIRELKDNPGKMINAIYRVRDGEEALSFLLSTGEYENSEKFPWPDLVLLDLKLPKVNGLDVLKKIREHEHIKEIPVIVLTTSSHEKDVMKSFKSGSDFYITKPVKYNEFMEAIRSLRLIEE